MTLVERLKKAIPRQEEYILGEQKRLDEMKAEVAELERTTLLEGAQWKLDIALFEQNSRGFNSILKGIPFSEENVKIAKAYCARVKGRDLNEFRIRFRADRRNRIRPVLKSGYAHTCKIDAERFDVYYA